MKVGRGGQWKLGRAGSRGFKATTFYDRLFVIPNMKFLQPELLVTYVPKFKAETLLATSGPRPEPHVDPTAPTTTKIFTLLQ
jgi:hypothetical protein